MPEHGELVSAFKMRKIKFAVSWGVQRVTLFAILHLVAHFWIRLGGTTTLKAFSFALSFGAVMAMVATLWLSISWAKARLLGPDGAILIEVVHVDRGTR